MKLLLLGSGGREHALAWKISKSSQLEKLYVAPGNAGTSEIAENIAIDINNFEAVGNFCIQNHSISMILQKKLTQQGLLMKQVVINIKKLISGQSIIMSLIP